MLYYKLLVLKSKTFSKTTWRVAPYNTCIINTSENYTCEIF